MDIKPATAARRHRFFIKGLRPRFSCITAAPPNLPFVLVGKASSALIYHRPLANCNKCIPLLSAVHRALPVNYFGNQALKNSIARVQLNHLLRKWKASA